MTSNSAANHAYVRDKRILNDRIRIEERIKEITQFILISSQLLFLLLLFFLSFFGVGRFDEN